MSAGGDPRGRSRGKRVKVRTAKGRKASSTRWLQRQLNDPYVAEAKRLGYRSRAAFKILWLDEKYKLFKRGSVVVDLGAAPGGWTQIVAEKLGRKGRLLAVDILEMEPVAGARLLRLDFMGENAEEKLLDEVKGPVDVVLSDLANSATGHRQTDHLRTMALCEAAHQFAAKVLREGGVFVAKVLQGGTEAGLLAALKRDFKTVRHAKPPASRAESTELYVVAQGFRRPNDGPAAGPEKSP